MSENVVSSLEAGRPALLAAAHRVAARASGLVVLIGPLLALGLGALLLGRRPLTVDEADAVAAATGRFGNVVEHTLEHDPARAGYVALLQPVVQLDDGERWLRAPSVVAAGVAALLVYFVGRALAGRLAGVAASVALATAGPVVSVSQQGRPYALAMAAVVLSTALFVLALRRGHPALWGVYAAGSALLPLTHPAASAAVLAHALSLAVAVPRPPLRLALPALGFVALENALLLAAFALDRNEAPAAALTLVGIGEGLARTAGWNPVLAGLAVWGVAALVLRRVHGGTPWSGALLAGLALFPLLGVLLASLAVPVFPATALVIGAPGVALAAGAGIAALPVPWWRFAAGAAAGITAAAGVAAWYAGAPAQDWQDAARFVSAAAERGETVVVVPERARAAFGYYAPQQGLSLRARGDGAWVVVGSAAADPRRAARAVVETPRYALLEQRRFGEALVAQHWVRP